MFWANQRNFKQCAIQINIKITAEKKTIRKILYIEAPLPTVPSFRSKQFALLIAYNFCLLLVPRV